MSAASETTGATDVLAIRLTVLEMTIAAVAARLPKADLEEVASMLVFVSQSSDTVGGIEVDGDAVGGPNPVRHYATEMLERIAKSRRPSAR